MFLVSDLPKGVGVYILTRWIQCSDLCKLDCATSNVNKRVDLLVLFAQTYFILYHENLPHLLKNRLLYYSWVQKRKLKCRELLIQSDFFQKKFVNILNESDNSSVTSLKIGLEDIYYTNLTKCQFFSQVWLRGLSCALKYDKFTFRLQTGILTNITSLFIQTNHLSNTALNCVANHCSKLFHFTLYTASPYIDQQSVVRIIMQNKSTLQSVSVCLLRTFIYTPLCLLNELISNVTCLTSLDMTIAGDIQCRDYTLVHFTTKNGTAKSCAIVEENNTAKLYMKVNFLAVHNFFHKIQNLSEISLEMWYFQCVSKETTYFCNAILQNSPNLHTLKFHFLGYLDTLLLEINKELLKLCHSVTTLSITDEMPSRSNHQFLDTLLSTGISQPGNSKIETLYYQNAIVFRKSISNFQS